MVGQVIAGKRKTSAMSLVVSCAVLAMSVLALGGCFDKQINPYTGRQASLDVAKEDHAAAGEQLETKIKEIAAAAVKTQAQELEAARAREAERVRRFEFERGKLEREFAARRAVTQAEHENVVADLAMSRDADVAAYYAAAKVAGDDAQRAALSQVTTLRETYAANDKFIRDWQRQWEDGLSKWTLGIDVASQVAGAVPGGGIAQTLIASLGTLLLGGAGATVVTQRRGRKREDSAWDEGFKTAKAEEASKREAADKAWDEADAKAKPDPTIALVTTLVSAIAGANKQGSSSPAGPAGKDAA